MGELAKLIIDLIAASIEAATRTGKSLRDALAESLEKAAADIRAGRLNIDDAVEQARDDQARIDKLRSRGGLPGTIISYSKFRSRGVVRLHDGGDLNFGVGAFDSGWPVRPPQVGDAVVVRRDDETGIPLYVRLVKQS